MVHRRHISFSLLIAMLLLAVSASIAAAISPQPIYPSFNSDYKLGVRATGMGGAYTALSNDVTALLYNPAGIGKRFIDVTIGGATSNPEALESVALLLAETPTAEDFAKLPDSVGLSGLAAASLGPLAVGVVLNGDFDSMGNGAWRVTASQEAIGGLGFRIAKAPLGAGDLRLGISAHALELAQRYYSVTNDTVVLINEAIGKGFRFSIGAQANITSIVTLGVSAQNIGGKIEWDNNYTEELEPVYTGGVAIKLPILGIVLAADADLDNNVRFGAETSLLWNFISLRIGHATSPDRPATTTGGMSLNLGPFSGGVAISSIGENATSATTEFSIRF